MEKQLKITSNSELILIINFEIVGNMKLNIWKLI